MQHPWASRVDGVLENLLPISGHACAPDVLLEAMRYSVLAPGKRLRPALLYEAGCAFGAAPERLDLFAAAIEMLHAASLIHDDMPCMDDDDLRRGRPTCHKRYGEAMALLAGDALNAHAFEVMLGEAVRLGEPGCKAALEAARATGLSGIAGGQALDMQAQEHEINEALLIRLQEGKTAALITASVVCGALLGGADDVALAHVRQYGYHLGLAFQMADDILNVTGAADALGKATGSDEAKGKLTAVSVWGLGEAKHRLSQHTKEALAAVKALGLRAECLGAMAMQLLERKR